MNGELAAEEYAVLRAEHLVPHTAALRALLAQAVAPNPPEPG